MRNDFIGTDIDGDTRTINGGMRPGCGCQHHDNTCGCNREGRTREYPCNERLERENSCSCRENRQRECSCNERRERENSCGYRENRERECPCNERRERENSCGCREHRQRQCPCDERSEGNGRGCCNDCACSTINRESCRRTPAMVYAEDHTAENTYCAAKALARGTLFPCLDKPVCNECSGDEAPCATQCQQERFTIWELRLYLDTHPCDQYALTMLREKCREMDCDCMRMQCASDSETRWDWLEEPWPWEFTRCCGREA